MSTHADWEIGFIGTGSFLNPRFGLPSTLLHCAGGPTVLVDCGDGALSAMRRADQRRVETVLLTNVTAETTSGLLALAESTWRSSERPLQVIGPHGTTAAVSAYAQASSLDFAELFAPVEIEPGTTLLQEGGVFVEAIAPLVMSAETCLAYLLFEEPAPGRVDTAAAEAAGISGPEFFELQQGRAVRGVQPRDILGPARRGRRVVIGGRGRISAEWREALQGADLAICAAPFMEDRSEIAHASDFMTGREIAEVARAAHVPLVLAQRIAPYAALRDYLTEARQFHPDYRVPRPGQTLLLPFPDMGKPQLVDRRPDGRQPARTRSVGRPASR